MVFEVRNLLVQKTFLLQLPQLVAGDLEEVCLEVCAFEVVAGASGEEEKLVGHVVCADFVDFEELFVDGLVSVEILGVYAVLADILYPLYVVLQLIVQTHILLLLLLNLALLLRIMGWTGWYGLALLFCFCLLRLTTCRRDFLRQNVFILLSFRLLLWSKFASAEVQLLDLILVGSSRVSMMTFRQSRSWKLGRRIDFVIAIGSLWLISTLKVFCSQYFFNLYLVVVELNHLSFF